MAKQIEDIILRLKQEGFENLDKIKGSFRELNKVTGFTEKDIDKVRGRLNEFAKEAGNTEAVNKGLIEAFKGLKSQVDVNGKAYGELAAEITRMESVLRGSTAAIDKQRAVLLEHARTGTQNAKSLQQQIDGLERLQRQTRPGSAAFLQLGKDIDQATKNLGRFKSEASAAAATLTQIPAASLEKIAAQIGRLQGQMQKLNISSDEFLRYQQRIALIGTVRTRTEGRQQVRALNAMFESEQYAQFAEGRAANLELPDTLAGIRLRISEINAELENITGYERRRALTVELKDLNRQLKNAIVDVVTQEDLALQRLRARVNAQREVNQASGFRAFSQQVGGGEFDPAITKSVRRGRQRLEEENERLRKAANEAFNLSNTPLLLPAAGQTSAPGTGAPISGGARRLVPGRTETTFGTPDVRAAAQQAGLPTAATGIAAAIGMTTDAYAGQARAAFKANESLGAYFTAINKATQGSNNSINSLNEQRQAWENLRNAIPRTYALYGEAGKEIEKLDKQLERSQLQRRRLSGMQVAQGVGAALSGGIFGGPEGLAGGLVGLAAGGVGGAFAGAAAGAQIGMLRQQLGLVAQYVAQLNLAKTTLAQASTGQDDYNKMLTTARSISADYAVTLQDTLRGYAQVAVAARANGLSTKEIEQVYRGVIAAGVAFGKSQADLDAIVTATVQVLSKGKVSAEELGGQIGERLPGAVAKFAAATGRTLPELAKALEDGKVNIRDFVKFAQQQFTDYDSIARTIGDSPEKAGARLQIALNTVAESYGSFLQNSGATFQDAATHVLTWVTSNEKSIKRFLAALSVFGKDLAALLQPIAQTTVSILKPVFSFIFENAARGISAIRSSLQALQQTDYAGASARAQKAVEKLYPNPVERALRGAEAYREALNVELRSLDNQFGASYTKRLDEEAARLFKTFKPSQYGTSGAGATAAAGTATDAKTKDSVLKKLQTDFDKTLSMLGRQFNAVSRNKLLEDAYVLENKITEALKQGKIDEVERLRIEQKRSALKTTQLVLIDESDKLEQQILTGKTKGLNVENAQVRLEQVRNDLKEVSLDLTKLDNTELEKRVKIEKDLRDALSGAFGMQQLGIFGEIPQIMPTWGPDETFMPSTDVNQAEAKRAADELKKLTEPLATLTSAAEAMGTAFSNSFAGIVNGSMSAQQSLASFFTNIANYFLDMASKIIAKWIEMAILNSLLKLLPTGSFSVGPASLNLPGLQGAGALSSGSSVLGTTDWASQGGGFFSNLKMNALGNAYAANGIVPFAMGGVVNQPTLFKFANGGAGRLGLMGEAGPEAIMPLRRLPSGRLGVEAGGGGTTNVTVNVDASGSSSVQGDPGRAEQLGRVITQAVRAELVRQKMPGGILT
jgi:tape measure domain-containing protein